MQVTNFIYSHTDTRRRQKRRKQGGNKKVCFTEGWVEFCDKKIAKNVAKCLNATQIGKQVTSLTK